MKIGICLPNIGKFTSARNLVAVALEAERAGLDSVWLSDHIALPKQFVSRYPYSRDGRPPFNETDPILEALTSLAFIAGKTERVTIGTSVLVLPLRHGTLVAKQLGTICALAPGRLIIGLGSGWLEDEFNLLNVNFKGRGDNFDQGLRALKDLLSPLSVESSNDPIVMEPRPLITPEIWIGGNGNRSLNRIVNYADAWHAGGGKTQDLSATMSRIKEIENLSGRTKAVALTARVSCTLDRDSLLLASPLYQA